MSALRMTEQEWAELQRRTRISRTQKRVRRAGSVGVAADSQNAGVGRSRKVPAVTVSPYFPYKSKLEFQYAAHLDLLKKAGEIKRWEYEPWRLWLSRGVVNPVTGKLEGHASYRPDFLVVLPSGMESKAELHEVKGKWIKNKRDSMTHLKWAAQKYGDVFTFRLIEWTGHGWDGHCVEEP